MRQPDPRNPQPGQVWEREGQRASIILVLNGAVSWRLDDNIPELGDVAGKRFIRWACPWWRPRKHWAKCVEWKEGGR